MRHHPHHLHVIMKRSFSESYVFWKFWMDTRYCTHYPTIRLLRKQRYDFPYILRRNFIKDVFEVCKWPRASWKRKNRNLLEKFALLFEGCTEAETYFIGISSTFQSNAKILYDSSLLPPFILQKKSSDSAEEQLKLISFILRIYGKSRSSSVSVILVSCITNKRNAPMINKRFFGSSSWRSRRLRLLT